MDTKILYHTSKINPITGQVNYDLKYSSNVTFRKGFLFTDLIEYIPSYLELEKSDLNYGRIIPVNSIFSCEVSEIFYDKNKYKQLEENINQKSITNSNIQEQENNIESNGLNLIKIYNKNKDYLGNEYAIFEKYQIFPFYTLTLKRNEFCVLWRDLRFLEESEYSKKLDNLKKFCIENVKINFYGESSTEEALKFLIKRKYDKVILITTIEKDLSGKRFIQIARKIFGFDIIVLFFSEKNNNKDLEWISDYPNCLYTDKFEICEEYIKNYNKTGLKNLKEKIENEYSIKLKKFSSDFLLYPNYKKEGDFSSLDFKSYYIKHVYIKNGNKYLYMKNNKKYGKVITSEEKCAWDITILDNEITLFSNGFYMDLNQNNENVLGLSYMKKWNFEKNDEFYNFIYPEKENNNVLSIEGEEVLVNKETFGENETFQLIEASES